MPIKTEYVCVAWGYVKCHVPPTMHHYNDVIMGAMTPQITSPAIVYSITVYSKKTSKLRDTGLCAGNSPVTGEFPAQMASNAEIVSIWWRHHVILSFCVCLHVTVGICLWPCLCISLYLSIHLPGWLFVCLRIVIPTCYMDWAQIHRYFPYV